MENILNILLEKKKTSRFIEYITKDSSTYYHSCGRNFRIIIYGEISKYDKLNFSETLEKVISLYIFYGENFVEKLDGCFLIILEDNDKLLIYKNLEKLYRFYYAIDCHGTFYFSSDLKKLISSANNLPLTINENFLLTYAIFGFATTDKESLIREINQLPCGSYLKIHNGQIELKSFVTNNFKGPRLDKKNLYSLTLDNISTILNQNNKEAIAMCLSGGLDSTIVGLIASKVNNIKVYSHTITARGSSIDDLEYAKQVSKIMQSDHCVVNINLNDLTRNLIPFIFSTERPGFDGIYFPNGELTFFILLKHMAENYKIALTGDGPDELFCGYGMHAAPKKFLSKVKSSYYFLKNYGGNSDAMEDFLNSYKPEGEKVYDLLLDYGLNEQVICGNKMASHFNLIVDSPFLAMDVIDFAKSVKNESIKRSKTDKKYFLKEAFAGLFKMHGLENILIRQKQSLPSAVEFLSKDFDVYLNSLAHNNLKGKYSYLLKKSEKLMFDIFYYMFIIKRCVNVQEDIPLEDLINEKEFRTMYD